MIHRSHNLWSPQFNSKVLEQPHNECSSTQNEPPTRIHEPGAKRVIVRPKGEGEVKLKEQNEAVKNY